MDSEEHLLIEKLYLDNITLKDILRVWRKTVIYGEILIQLGYQAPKNFYGKSPLDDIIKKEDK